MLVSVLDVPFAKCSNSMNMKISRSVFKCNYDGSKEAVYIHQALLFLLGLLTKTFFIPAFNSIILGVQQI
jgi:hypothetical protein